jgi:DNA (cytosine-5)-methyltransferase 1
MLRFYDFFAGAGLATMGLRHAWECVWANDIDLNKGRVYKANFGPGHFHPGDVAGYTAADLPHGAQLSWASFPCQDLSLAGWRHGISAERSGAFWAFWKIMREQHQHGGRPPVIAIENVAGLLYGDSFAGLCEALAALEMHFGALVVDARRFVPQSRPRVFIVAVDAHVDCGGIGGPEPVAEWTPQSLVNAQAGLESDLRKLWRWWQLPVPEISRVPLTAIIETVPTGVEWHTREQTQRLLSLMSDINRAKVTECQLDRKRQIGFLYKRIRNGVQRAEVRFDGLSGCLRTPRGGSSRQTVVLVEDGVVRTRLLSPREAARLMGVPDTFQLPEKYNDAYEAMGDAVVAPVVRWLSENLLEPLARLAQPKPLGKTTAQAHRLMRNAEQRASEWRLEHKRMSNS